MTVNPSDPAGPSAPSSDDTAAFQRFYIGDQPKAGRQRSWLYRALIGWWRDR